MAQDQQYWMAKIKAATLHNDIIKKSGQFHNRLEYYKY